jgi:hypothetical protein
VSHELPARDRCRAEELRLPALKCWPIVTEPHHMGDSASVAAVGLVGSRRQEALRRVLRDLPESEQAAVAQDIIEYAADDDVEFLGT